MREDNVAAAHALYDLLLRYDPSSFRAHLLHADAYEAGGERKEALARCQRALEIKPDLPDALLRVARLHRSLDHKPEVTVRAYKKALDVIPADHPLRKEIEREFAHARDRLFAWKNAEFAAKKKIAAALGRLALDYRAPDRPAVRNHAIVESLRLLSDARDLLADTGSVGEAELMHPSYGKPLSLDILFLLRCRDCVWDEQIPASTRRQICERALKVYHDLRERGGLKRHPQKVRVLLAAALIQYLSNAYPLARASLSEVERNWLGKGSHRSAPHRESDRKLKDALLGLMTIQGLQKFSREGRITLPDGRVLTRYRAEQKPEGDMPWHGEIWILEAPERGLAGTASLSAYPCKDERRWYLYDRSFGQEALLKTYGREKPAPEDAENWLKQELLKRAKGRPYAQEQFARPIQETWHALSTADMNLAELERGPPTPKIPDPATRLTTTDVNRLLPAGLVVHRDRLKILAPSAKEVGLGSSRLIPIRCLNGTIPLKFAYVYKRELIQILN
jgi:tetratricopeptide (TPR) repeat protein